MTMVAYGNVVAQGADAIRQNFSDAAGVSLTDTSADTHWVALETRETSPRPPPTLDSFRRRTCG